MMKSGTRGMGRGEIDRMDGWFQDTYFGGRPTGRETKTIKLLRNIISHNEVRKLLGTMRAWWREPSRRHTYFKLINI